MKFDVDDAVRRVFEVRIGVAGFVAAVKSQLVVVVERLAGLSLEVAFAE